VKFSNKIVLVQGSLS